MQNHPGRVKFPGMSNFVAAASYGSCQILLYVAAAAAAASQLGLGQNLKKLQIYDIIKGWAYRPAQQIQLVSNFAFRANLCYNILVR
jgi:hypothetical protein